MYPGLRSARNGLFHFPTFVMRHMRTSVFFPNCEMWFHNMLSVFRQSVSGFLFSYFFSVWINSDPSYFYQSLVGLFFFPGKPLSCPLGKKVNGNHTYVWINNADYLCSNNSSVSLPPNVTWSRNWQIAFERILREKKIWTLGRHSCSLPQEKYYWCQGALQTQNYHLHHIGITCSDGGWTFKQSVNLILHLLLKCT